MVDLKCRLCSSTCALISLSGGKCRKNRDYIRKLVEITTGIKFGSNDLYKYICYPCTVHIYNFNIFKTKSLENEEKLKAHIMRNEKSKSNKIQIADLRDIVLPSINELKDTLAPWLISKSQYCKSKNSEQDDDTNKEKTSEHNRITDNASKTAKNDIQNVPGIDVSIQCQLPKNTSNKSTQIDLTSSTCDKFTQCVVPNIAIHTQTNGILTKSSKVQCCLLRDLDTQQKSKTVDKGTQHYDTCEHCKEIDCKCYVHNLVNIKPEPQLVAPVNLSPINSLIISPIKSNSSIPSTSSPITNWPATKNTSANMMYCKICDTTGFSKEAYMLHKKSHMICSFCKKKFTSIKRTKYHIDNDCETKKRVDMPTVVQLIKIENLQEVQKKYSTCLEDLKKFERGRSKIRSLIRMRSRSTSSADSRYNCCNFCSNCKVTVLHEIKIGMDKSVQTNMFDNQVHLGLVVNGGITFKSSLKNVGDLMSPTKKRKLSDPLKK